MKTRGRGTHDNQRAWKTRQLEGVEYTATRRRGIHDNQKAWNTRQPEGVEYTTTRGRGIHGNQKACNTRQPEGVEYTTTRRRGIHDNMVGPVYNGSICQFPNCSDGGEVLRGYLNIFFLINRSLAARPAFCLLMSLFIITPD